MYGTDRPKEKGHGGASHDLKDKTSAAATLLSGQMITESSDNVNPESIAGLDSLLDVAHVTPSIASPVLESKTAPSGLQGPSKTLSDVIGHLATTTPQRVATAPREAPAEELARLRAENAKLKATLQDIRNDSKLAGRGKPIKESAFIVIARLRADFALSTNDGPRVYDRGVQGFYDATDLGLSYGAVNEAMKQLQAVSSADIESYRYGLDKDGRRVDHRSPQAVEVRTDSTLTVYPLPRRLPELRQTESQVKAAIAKSEKREKAKRDAATVAKLEAMTCPCCGETGLEALCTACGAFLTPDDYQALIDGTEAPSEAVTVTVERLPAALLEDKPVLDSETRAKRGQNEGKTGQAIDPISQSELLNNNPVSESETPPIEKVINSPIRESVSADGLSLVVTADDVLLVAKASTHIASKLVETVGFNVNTRTELRAKILKITDAPPISNEEAIAIVIELAQRGRYDLAVMVGNAYKLPSATRKELLDQYIEIGSKAA